MAGGANLPRSFQPGQSANPGGMSKSQRESYLEAKAIQSPGRPTALEMFIRHE